MFRWWVIITFVFVGLTSCNEDVPEDNFGQIASVRITDPVHGATVATTFAVSYTKSEDVLEVAFTIDDLPVDMTLLDAQAQTMVLTVSEGTHRVGLIGKDSSGVTLTDYHITVNAINEEDDEEDSWVTLTSPIDGDTVYNPVTFTINASADIDHVDVLADDWKLGTMTADEIFSYTFTGTGYSRHISVQAFRDDKLVATDSLEITVEADSEPLDSDFNDILIELLESYPTDGTHDYYWPEDGGWYGTTQDIYYQGELVAEGDPEGRCFCVGLTWEVYMRAFEAADKMTGGTGSLNGMTVSDLTEFRIDWFIRDLWGDGNVDALENYGLGERVTNLEDAQHGDIVQFWRNSGSGHNNLFIEWVRADDDNTIIGLTYWSTQGSTDGIGYNTEYFGSSGSSINPSYLFLARPYMPWDWFSW